MSDPNFHIPTPRLFISHQSPSNDAHCDFAVALLHNPASIKHNPSGPTAVPDREAARSFITTASERLARTGYGRYLVSLRLSPSSPFSPENQELIGVVTLQLQRYPSSPGPLIPDIGFNFLPQYHGKGYAKEAAQALMEWYTREKQVEKFAALTDETNGEAKKLLGKLGFREWGERVVRGVSGGGEEERLSVWTRGVEEEGELEGLRL
ncbi:hypothetical protein HBI71_000170 [Parastagonospora nodorum]|nr:hypothetical protein HBI71_000170 [Parastagonospora nodorum]KAH5424882.1 hypothetical protein HBI47_121490 [Parastagonospora nodorum]